MKVVEPSRMLVEAAELLAGVREHVVVVGATALEVALSDQAVTVTPTRDVDVVVPAEVAADVIERLESAGLRRSELAHERPFTWVRGDLKVQLVRTFHPFPKPPADVLPENPVFGMAAKEVHQVQISFVDDRDEPRLVCANTACVLALKHAAFGRTRPGDAGLSSATTTTLTCSHRLHSQI